MLIPFWDTRYGVGNHPYLERGRRCGNSNFSTRDNTVGIHPSLERGRKPLNAFANVAAFALVGNYRSLERGRKLCFFVSIVSVKSGRKQPKPREGPETSRYHNQTYTHQLKKTTPASRGDGNNELKPSFFNSSRT